MCAVPSDDQPHEPRAQGRSVPGGSVPGDPVPGDSVPGDPTRIGPVIVGIEHDEPSLVLREAARFAADLGTELVCAHVDSTRYPVDEHDDGSVTSMALDPEIPDIRDEVVSPELEASVRDVLAEWRVPLRFVALAGDPAQSLGELAETLDARAVVVGSRRPGFRAGLEEFFTGSIAVRLVHRQKRPVIVIPLDPHAAAAPWEFEG